MIIPVEVNGAKLSFLLDSGVSTPILFNLSDQDSVQINNVTEIAIKGLGEGAPMKGLSSAGNTLKINSIVNRSQKIYVVLDKDINFSPSLGVPVHGIIGYDLFKDFVVEINYGSKTIKFHDPKTYRSRLRKNQERLPLIILDKKAYVDGMVSMGSGSEIPVRLLVDTGSSDAIWLFEDEEKGLDIPEKHYDDYLGKGLSGNIFGKRTMVDGFKLGSHSLKGPKTAFPDMESFNAIKNLGERNGSIGGEILKRFNLVFNYSKNEVIIKRNGNFKAPFRYNLSGIELMHDGMRYIAEKLTDARGIVKSDEKSFGNVQLLMEGRTRLSLVPEIVVSSIRAGSPAHEAGLLEGDLILTVNGKSVHQYKLQEVLQMLNEREGKRVKLVIERYNKDLLFSFVLKKVFK
ncbi:aspartyl protease family protein [Flavobacteriaceae bacterium KMM 6897]|nr:aspartyl protease family protein [Flavobacteriaceae bacterium KMM 6897]MEB8347323.1 aspartyl protease family protein [Flavobacteriaceae bacterium KMM 6898]